MWRRVLCFTPHCEVWKTFLVEASIGQGGEQEFDLVSNAPLSATVGQTFDPSRCTQVGRVSARIAQSPPRFFRRCGGSTPIAARRGELLSLLPCGPRNTNFRSIANSSATHRRDSAKRRQVPRLRASPVGVCSAIGFGDCSRSRLACSERTPYSESCQASPKRPTGRGGPRPPA